RHAVRVRYLREERDTVEALARIAVATAQGATIPLGQLARFEYVRGPQVIKAEDTLKTAYITFVAAAGLAAGDAAEQVRAELDRRRAAGALVLPDGVTYELAGDYENQVRSEQRLVVLIPVALLIVFFLLYIQFRRTSTALIIYTGVVIAVAGSFILLWLYTRPGFLALSAAGIDLRALAHIAPIKLSVAVWVGIIALIGIATDNGVVLATYVKQQLERAPLTSVDDIRERIVIAGQRRVRACLMTTATTILALLPVITGTGRGSDVMAPMAVPVLGGAWATLLTLLVVPVLQGWVAERRFARAQTEAGATE
ncbi:MAG: efflux RND transporter permease subunit, partial [Myxococcota bacterium]